MGENERETREEKTFVRNGSRKWHGNVQDGAGTVTVTNTVRTGNPPMTDHPTDDAALVICPKRREAPAFATSQLSPASNAVVTWHKHVKADQ
jgi:hypothetical protein